MTIEHFIMLRSRLYHLFLSAWEKTNRKKCSRHVIDFVLMKTIKFWLVECVQKVIGQCSNYYESRTIMRALCRFRSSKCLDHHLILLRIHSEGTTILKIFFVFSFFFRSFLITSQRKALQSIERFDAIRYDLIRFNKTFIIFHNDLNFVRHCLACVRVMCM